MNEPTKKAQGSVEPSSPADFGPEEITSELDVSQLDSWMHRPSIHREGTLVLTPNPDHQSSARENDVARAETLAPVVPTHNTLSDEALFAIPPQENVDSTVILRSKSPTFLRPLGLAIAGVVCGLAVLILFFPAQLRATYHKLVPPKPALVILSVEIPRETSLEKKGETNPRVQQSANRLAAHGANALAAGQRKQALELYERAWTTDSSNAVFARIRQILRRQQEAK